MPRTVPPQHRVLASNTSTPLKASAHGLTNTLQAFENYWPLLSNVVFHYSNHSAFQMSLLVAGYGRCRTVTSGQTFSSPLPFFKTFLPSKSLVDTSVADMQAEINRFTRLLTS
jgi:hypothetical protein